MHISIALDTFHQKLGIITLFLTEFTYFILLCINIVIIV